MRGVSYIQAAVQRVQDNQAKPNVSCVYSHVGSCCVLRGARCLHVSLLASAAGLRGSLMRSPCFFLHMGLWLF